MSGPLPLYIMTITDIINEVFPTKVLSKGEYQVASKIIQHLMPDIQQTDTEISDLYPINKFMDVLSTVLVKYYKLYFYKVFGKSRNNTYLKYRKMSYMAMVDVVGVDRYTVQRAFSKYRSRLTVYNAISEFPFLIESSLEFKMEYENFKRHIREEYEKEIAYEAKTEG